MTDGGALAAGFSRTLDTLAPSLAGVVTVGQAFGGRPRGGHPAHGAAGGPARAERGPRRRHPGAGQPRHGDAVGLLRAWPPARRATRSPCWVARPIGALRISDADPRPRHRGVSHHSLTAFGRVALGGVTLVAPRGLTSELGGQVDEDLAGQPPRNPVVWVDTDGLDEALGLSPVPLRTMGRGFPRGAGLLPGRGRRRALRRAAVPCRSRSRRAATHRSGSARRRAATATAPARTSPVGGRSGADRPESGAPMQSVTTLRLGASHGRTLTCSR